MSDENSVEVLPGELLPTSEIEIAKDTDPEEVKKQALAHENVVRFVTGEPKKVIYVPGRLVSVVV